MPVQQLREHISDALKRAYPEIPVFAGENAQTPHFVLELISATYDRQREGRYMAVYRFGIRFEQGEALQSENMADGLCEALSGSEPGNSAYRVVRQAWEAGTEGKGPLFTVDYMLYLNQTLAEPEMMRQMIGGERLK
ncbi:phage tail terminator family protein [Paenibacillus tepidiphilus]|uniref:phage tail terminator family protein n=1 Tax=Paenibacillus tepidiphilus TaxID=2608683 RepID=UPI001239B2E7|nr:hypothetical protein [Paenibacillus tepidiphilus]